jgi:tRNA-splicing ligase RtcB (3'-phosphate/5'-hydroxy nucleic acid ligase)
MAEYEIVQLSEYKWEVKKNENLGMRVPGIIYSDSQLMEHCRGEGVIDQVVNVSTLPGILKASFAMPDIHFGYGFPIGGVAAFDPENGGVISPGGVGFDISCGVRAIRSGLMLGDIKDKLEDMISFISFSIPRGLGGKGNISLSKKDMEDVLSTGIDWAVSRGYCNESEKQFIEEGGRVKEADPLYVSEEAKKRGCGQLGTLGSGNHFLELQTVDRIYDEHAADVLGLRESSIVIMIHTGSRGLGHQICSDYLRIMQKASSKYEIKLPDKQLACAPVYSDEGKDYYKAMACGANYAMVNRQCLTYQLTSALKKYLGGSYDSSDIATIYDVSHNIARLEEHDINGVRRKVCVHRKGATRSFGPGRPELSSVYREIGQPVIIPGSMGSYSFILLGTETAMSESFGSTCHGAGRMMSRSKAKKTIRGDELKKSLKIDRGITIIADSMPGLAEEAPQAYKDICRVVNVSCMAGLSKKVARLRPLGVIKG